MAYYVIEGDIFNPELIDRQIVHFGNYEPFYKYKVEIQVTLPALSYDTLFVAIDQSTDLPEVAATTKIEAENIITTNLYEVTVNPNGTIDLVDRRTERLFGGLLLLEDSADDGDEYDYSPLLGDQPIISHSSRPTIKRADSRWGTRLTISHDLKVPYNLEERKNGHYFSHVKVRLELGFIYDEPMIGLVVSVDNAANDHRLRIHLPTTIHSQVSFSDHQFGEIKRPFIDDALHVWEKEDWDERPDGIFPMLSYVDIKDIETNHGLRIIKNSS